MMKAAVALALLAIPLVAAAPTVHAPCDAWLPAGAPVDNSCAFPIHPGAQMANGCTTNWVLRDDASDLYIGSAGHCASSLAPDLLISGIDHPVGRLVYDGLEDGDNDSSWFRINVADRVLVTGTIEGIGGPVPDPVTGKAYATPVPGEPLIHVGRGYYTNGYPQLRARPAETVYAWPTHNLVIFVSSALSGGDSGSPLMTASGQAVGHVWGGVFPVGLACGVAKPPVCPDAPGNVGLGVNIQTEMQALSARIGRHVTLVTGVPTLTTT